MISADKVPVVQDEVLDYVGEVWAAQDKKTFPTFLSYLSFHMYGREQKRKSSERIEKPEASKQKAA